MTIVHFTEMRDWKGGRRRPERSLHQVGLSHSGANVRLRKILSLGSR